MTTGLIIILAGLGFWLGCGGLAFGLMVGYFDGLASRNRVDFDVLAERAWLTITINVLPCCSGNGILYVRARQIWI